MIRQNKPIRKKSANKPDQKSDKTSANNITQANKKARKTFVQGKGGKISNVSQCDIRNTSEHVLSIWTFLIQILSIKLFTGFCHFLNYFHPIPMKQGKNSLEKKAYFEQMSRCAASKRQVSCQISVFSLFSNPLISFKLTPLVFSVTLLAL
jgi:hypothetical protein